MQIRYTVRAAVPAEHLGRFTLELGGVAGPTVDLVLPSWVPGSYHILPYQRPVGPFSARGSPDGPALRVERIDKGRWRIHTGGASSLRVDYEVYGHDLVTEGFDLTPEHLFVNAALCLPYVDGHQNATHEVVIDAPAPWRVVTELPAVGAETRTFRAASYEELADSPIDVGSPVVLTIRPHGIPHRISLCGDGGNYDAQKVAADLTKIVDATIDLLGASPLSSYTFFYHLNDRSDGGLEHATSNSCVIPRTTFVPDKDYKWFLGLTSHEYFHLYNVKRIRPKAFQPFDLTQEVYTRLLWWMEGTTDYFSDLVLRRAGLYTPKEYLANSAELIQRYLETPGRLRSSLEDASYLTWVDFYQPYEETLNRTVSYYLKGNLVSLCLDLELRHRTENRTSLETVLRTLWSEFGATGRGVEEDGIRAVSEQVSGLDLAPFFDRYVRGTEEIDFDAFARYAGLAFGPKAKPADDDSPVAGYLGVRAEESDGLARLRVVLAGSPARAAGLTPGDEIVAINGTRVTFTNFEKTFARYPPGTPIALTVFRRGLLREVGVTTGLPPPEKYEFRPVEAPTELAKSVFATWIGVPWEPEKPGATATPAAV